MVEVPDTPGYGWLVYPIWEELGSLAIKLAEDPYAYREGLLVEQGSVRLSWDDEDHQWSEQRPMHGGPDRCYMQQGPLHQVKQGSHGTRNAFSGIDMPVPHLKTISALLPATDPPNSWPGCVLAAYLSYGHVGMVCYGCRETNS
jgi:hypothetical protein